MRKHPELGRVYTRPNAQKIVDRIRAVEPAARVEDLQVDEASFARWISDARYPILAYHVNSRTKFLEHFLSVELIGARTGTLMDVASCRSYFPELMRRRGFRVIVQDLTYTPGLHGDILGSNAAAMPIPDASIDVMTLHCAFEHFEGSSDTGFIREAARVLKPGGRVVLLPLYLNENALTWVDPYFLAIGERVEEQGSTWQPAVGYSNRFGRMYAPENFVERVYRPALESGLKPTLLRVVGMEAASWTYLQFALVLDSPL